MDRAQLKLELEQYVFLRPFEVFPSDPTILAIIDVDATDRFPLDLNDIDKAFAIHVGESATLLAMLLNAP